MYVYKIVKCKSCGTHIEIEFLGPALNLRVAGVIRNPGRVRCTNCAESYDYLEKDTHLAVRDSSPVKRREAG